VLYRKSKPVCRPIGPVCLIVWLAIKIGTVIDSKYPEQKTETMKKQVILIVALTMSTLVYAQHKGSGHHHDKLSDKMKTELSLNDTQYAAIKSIEEKYGKQHTSLRKDSTKAKDEKFKAMKALRDEKQKEIDAVLTPDQKSKWVAYQQAQMQKRNEHMQKAGERYEEKMKTDLSLSNEQFDKVKAANKTFIEKLSQLRKEGQPDADRKSAVKEIREEHESSMKSILTPEQYSKWNAHKQEMKNKHSKHRRRG
jgi:Spy/CpxP family protein refolding chaperone